MDSRASFSALCARQRKFKLGLLGFTSPAEFDWARKDGADDTIEAISDTAEVDVASAPSKVECGSWPVAPFAFRMQADV